MKELYSALAKAQGEFPSIPKNKEVVKRGLSKSGKPFEYSYWYADWETIVTHVRPILAKHGLSFSQSVLGDICFTKIRHSSGESEILECPIILNRSEEQKLGGSLTYGKRYAFSLAFGISTDDDLDANELKDEEYEVKSKGATANSPKQVNTPSVPPRKEVVAPSTTAAEPPILPPHGYVREYGPSEAQIKRLWAIANRMKWAPAYVNAYVKKHYNKSVKTISVKEYNEFCNMMEATECTDAEKHDLKDFVEQGKVMKEFAKAKKEFVDHTAPNPNYEEELPF